MYNTNFIGFVTNAEKYIYNVYTRIFREQQQFIVEIKKLFANNSKLSVDDLVERVKKRLEQDEKFIKIFTVNMRKIAKETQHKGNDAKVDFSPALWYQKFSEIFYHTRKVFFNLFGTKIFFNFTYSGKPCLNGG